jgi:TorA maturation chaperone TorD
MADATAQACGIGVHAAEQAMLTGALGRTTVADQAGRWELLRALGALVADTPARTSPVARSLGLPAWTAAEHTELFVLSLPPFASIHLSADGKLGGEATDRVAGFWRVLGLAPPADPDHLGAILALYAELGDASMSAREPRTRDRLDRARETVLWEHLWSWLPGYLQAADTEAASAEPWVRLMRRALIAEAQRSRQPTALPLALRTAPEPVSAALGYEQLLDALTARMRTGCVLTYRDVASGARQLGLGLRRGERRFALKAMIDQDPALTLGWVADQAQTWVTRHGLEPEAGGGCGRWWALRAADTAHHLKDVAARQLQVLLVSQAILRHGTKCPAA